MTENNDFDNDVLPPAGSEISDVEEFENSPEFNNILNKNLNAVTEKMNPNLARLMDKIKNDS